MYVQSSTGLQWSKGEGIYRELVAGVALIREDGHYYLRERNKIRSDFGFAYSVGKVYEWGRFLPPGETPSGYFPGQFTKTSNAMARNWNHYHEHGVVRELGNEDREEVELELPNNEPPLQQPDVKSAASNVLQVAIFIIGAVAAMYIVVKAVGKITE